MSGKSNESLLAEVASYYSDKLRTHGETRAESIGMAQRGRRFASTN